MYNYLSLFILLTSVFSVAFSTGVDQVKEKSLKSSGCEDSNAVIGTCNPIQEHVCYGFYSWEWVYTATATEPVSGKSASGGDNFSSSSGAATHATFNLFNILDQTSATDYDCNCSVGDKTFTDKCTLTVGVCFYFAAAADVQSQIPTFKSYAYDQAAGLSAASGPGYTNSTEAATAAVTNLLSSNPLEAKKCGFTTNEASERTQIILEEMKLF